VADIRTVVKED
jgi:hypothetical protein